MTSGLFAQIIAASSTPIGTPDRADRSTNARSTTYSAGFEFARRRAFLQRVDTHENQSGKYANNVRRFDKALTAFYDDLRKRDCFDDTLIIVFSEFGRRVAENGSKGTDHGVAGPMLVLGSQVNGGIYGRHPSLTELDEGDLIHTTDFRRVYATAIERWLGEDSQRALGGSYEPLEFV